MSISSILDGLNESQVQAVLDFENPLLVLAGAGSGKTGMLTSKIAFGLQEKRFQPYSFLAVTFTNKAADEMKHRVSKLVPGIRLKESWVSTFHSFGHRLLRAHAPKLGYDLDFSIFDNSDQLSLIKTLLKNINYDNSSAQARKVSRQIQNFKADLAAQKDPESFPWFVDFGFYENYQKELKKLNAMDFSDLLLKSHILLQSFPEVTTQIRDMFDYILVDEYQDTNLIQYEILKKLSYKKRNICAVGDEDQSIYSWRGANIFNILNFDKDFPGTRMIKMEQNYRSTKNIIGAASSVIANNSRRKKKTLFTENPKGELIEILKTQTEYYEAMTIANKIQELEQQTQHSFSDMAIFYRTNAQSRMLEEKLRNMSIPYRIYGSLKFYDRKEIKDILAYMRLMVNSRDDVSFRRVINTPSRGLGQTTLGHINSLAQQRGVSLFEASLEILSMDVLKESTREKLSSFLDIFVRLKESNSENNLSDFYEDLLRISQYLPNLEKEDSMEAHGRIKNLEELGNAIAYYEELHPDDAGVGPFLNHLALVSDEDSKNESNTVNLMTLHVAKGLEYPVVFVSGLEDGLFPLYSSDGPENMEMEEERRLFYVGMTRAKEKLYLSCASQRKVWGKDKVHMPSRFLKEIPEKFLKNPLKEKSFVFTQDQSFSQSVVEESFQELISKDSNDNTSPYRKGVRVCHPYFGDGVIYAVEGSGSREKISVLFDDQSSRKFFSQHANLELS